VATVKTEWVNYGTDDSYSKSYQAKISAIPLTNNTVNETGNYAMFKCTIAKHQSKCVFEKALPVKAFLTN
jgi:hypothetical protein